MPPGRKPVDLVLLLGLGGCWVLVFGLHLMAILERSDARPDFFVAGGISDDAYPTIVGFISETDRSSDLRIADRILRVGEVDVRGLGEYELAALARREAGSDLELRIEFERAGVARTQTIRLAGRQLPWSGLPLILGLAAVGAIVLLRSSATADARLFYAAALSFSIFLATIFMSQVVPVRTGVTLRLASGFVAIALLGFWLTRFPPGLPERERFGWPLPVAAAALWLGVRLNFVLGGPGATVNATVYQLVDVTLALVFLWILSSNYLRSDAIGRRRIKWVLLGGYIAGGAIAGVSLAGALGLERGFATLHALAILLGAAVPAGLLIAITRYNLLDVDRLISATASYSLLIFVFLAGALALLPRLAEAASGRMGIDPATGQWAASLVLAATLVPVHQRLRPWIDRWFFAERYSVDRGISELLPAMSACRNLSELVRCVGSGLTTLFRPRACACYAAQGDHFSPVFVEGRIVPVSFAADSPLIGTLRGHRQALALGEGARRGEDGALTPFDKAALDTLGVEVIVPVRRASALDAFFCLGSKRSGDVYTPTDIAQLAAIAEGMSLQLTRFDHETVLRESQALQTELRRYVPGAVADQLEAGTSPEAGVREVSVLFVDIRGYTQLAEGLQPHEIFGTVNRYTEAVSAIVRKHGGSVVEFNGDGMMAVFGAPAEIAYKERAAVEAGLEMLDTVGAIEVGQGEQAQTLSIGVGIASGEAYVGSIRAVDRMIWSALGNTTNLAARMQGLTRELDAGLVIDAATRNAPGVSLFDFERHDGTAIRGRSGAHDVYLRRA